MAPELTVVLPLFDERGDIAAHVASWSRDQTFDRSRYQVVAGSDGSDDARDAAVRAVLGEGDILAVVPGAGEMRMYNECAERAEAPWVVISEGHCIAEPDCLQAVADTIAADPELDVIRFTHDHVLETQLDRITARWFKDVYVGWDRPGGWQRLQYAGCAMRRDAYLEAGGIGEDLREFGMPLLAARLNERGLRFADAEAARIRHIHTQDVAEHHEHTVEFIEGELMAREELEPAFAERYFGLRPLWWNRAVDRPEVARPLLRRLAEELRLAARDGADRRWLAREAARAAPAAAAGPRPRTLGVTAGFKAREAIASRVPLDDDRRYRWFVGAHAACIKAAEAAVAATAPVPEPPAAGRWTASELDGGVLAGTHELEEVNGTGMRWTRPVSVLRLAPGGPARLSIDTQGLRGERGWLRSVWVGERRIDGDAALAAGGRIEVGVEEDDRLGDAPVIIVARPHEPAGDDRQLGVPVFSVELTPYGGA